MIQKIMTMVLLFDLEGPDCSSECERNSKEWPLCFEVQQMRVISLKEEKASGQTDGSKMDR
jgi:hypothetical protein